jgi:hypothetical protein
MIEMAKYKFNELKKLNASLNVFGGGVTIINIPKI